MFLANLTFASCNLCSDVCLQNASQSAVRLSEALREGEAQLKERARKALECVDNAYGYSLQLSLVL